MALTDDLTGFFSDFAVSATAGDVTGDVILNQPSSIAFDGQVIFTDFVAVVKTSDFGSLVAGDAIAVNSVNYVVRDNQADLDNLTCEISLSKV